MGWGDPLAEQLVALGEDVLDVPATLASRIRVLATGRSNKNDPNDARSVAIAAFGLRACAASKRPITARSCDSSPSATGTSAVIAPG